MTLGSYGISINVKMRLIGYYMSNDHFMRCNTFKPHIGCNI